MSVQGQGDTAGWRRYVKPLLPPRTAGEAAAPSGGPGLTHPAPGQADVAPTARTQLGLQFELRELVPRSSENWNGPLSQAVKAGRRTVSGEYRLGVRPALRTERGWARASLTWANIGHHGARRGLEESQQRWFRQLHALHRAAEAITFGQDPDWIFLDDFLSPALWAMLAQADELGIALVGQSGRTPVRLHAAAELRLEVAAGPDDGLVLTPVLRIDGEPARLGGGGAIGTHGLYLLPDGSPAGAGAERVITLAPVPDGLSQAEIALISAAQAAPPVVVPGAERQNFLREGVAELRTAFTLESADGSLVVPEPDPALIVLRAAWRSGHRLDLGWTHEGASGAYEPALAELLPPELVGVERIPEPWLEDLLPAGLELRGVDAAAFLANVVPALQLLPGIEVRISGAPPAYAELHGVPHLKVTTLPSEQADWFDLGVLVTVGEKTVPFGPLFRALAQGKKKLLLVDHTFLSLTHPSLQPLAELIAEAADLDEWQTGIRLHRHQVALWSEFEDLADESNAAVEWRQLVREVGAERPDPVAIPEGLTAELRDYQREGLHWLAFLWRNRLGGILADDMGLGKTLQCLALIAHAREGDATLPPFLVVAPTSVMSNWAAEAARFAPGLRVRVRAATAASSGRSVEADAREADIVVTSYALFRLDAEQYRAVAAYPALGFAGLILDEAQFVKNGASRGNELATEIPIRWKLAVTGTPIENSLRELHALCRIVAPGLFPSARRFEEEYVRSIERPAPGASLGKGAGSGPETQAALRGRRTERLRQRLRPFLLRRTKDLVAAELPEKQEQVLEIELDPAHRELYDVFLQRERRKLFGLIRDPDFDRVLDRKRFTVFRSLTLLRMLALDASLIDPQYEGLPSAKLDALTEHATALSGEGRRTLVFSQFTSFLDRARARLEAAGVRTVTLDGSTRNRDAVIAQFRRGDADVFLISLKAGGIGLNLTEADTVILLDPWWNPASEAQAIDRTHRIGQDRHVHVIRMIAAGTIEEKVLELQRRKQALFTAVIDDEQLFAQSITAADIRELLGDDGA